jgi:hypothetical protein
MVQAITPALTALLKSKLQVGADGFFGRIEIDRTVPATDVCSSPTVSGYYPPLGSLTSSADGLIMYGNGPTDPTPGYVGHVNFGAFHVTNVPSHLGWCDFAGDCAINTLRTFVRGAGKLTIYTRAYSSGTRPVTLTLKQKDNAGAVTTISSQTGYSGDTFVFYIPTSSTVCKHFVDMNDGPGSPCGGKWGYDGFDWLAIADDPAFDVIVSESFAATRIATDRSRAMAAAQLDVELPDETDSLGYYQDPDNLLAPNNQIRAYAWYGVRANEVRIFTGLLDRQHDARDPKTITLTARSRMKLLLEQLFEALAPQTAGTAGAVRTEANGVYLSKSPEYIVGDILDRAGWASADRDLATSGVTIDEYDLTDKTSWAQQIAGPDRLTTAAGFDFWEDELGVAHFRANALADGSSPSADYTLAAGVDVLKLDHDADDVDRKTRVRVTGPMTSAVPAWKQEWETTAIKYPVGAMYRSSESGYLYVIDAISQYLSKIRQSDRVVVAKWYLGGSLSYYPGGLSGDPSDSTIFWVLDIDWVHGGTTHAQVHKYRMSDKAHLASYSLPDGDWSDLKSDGTNLWLTNFGDDKLYKRSLTATAVANYSYAGHTNPTGMYLDGTTIALFFNDGTAFYLVSTSAPGTITGTQSTAGAHILGGEIDSTTHTYLYAVASAGDFGNAAGYVWKFALATLVTTNVSTLSADQALEDALGFQSGVADRVHDLHPLAAAHPFEIRLATYAMKTVYSVAQAQAVGDAQLALLKRIRRQMDLGTIGNPAVQINDVIRYIDPVEGTDAKWLLDTYRAELSGEGTYTTTMSLLPWVAP